MFANPQSRSILRFVSSWCISPLTLASIRALIAIYIFASIFAKLGTESPFEAGLDFSYFTSLTFWGLAFYFGVASAHGFSYVAARKRNDREVMRGGHDGIGGVESSRGEPWLARWPKWLQALHSFFYTTVVVFPFIVTIVFWAVLYQSFSTPRDVWTNVTQHALNSVFAFFEIVIPRTAHPPWYHAIYLVLILLAYMVVAYITFINEHTIVYGFLDYSRLGVALVVGIIIGIGVVTVILFFVVKGLIALRILITERKMGRLGKLYAEPTLTTAAASSWENVPERDLETVDLSDEIPLKGVAV